MAFRLILRKGIWPHRTKDPDRSEVFYIWPFTEGHFVTKTDMIRNTYA